MNALFGSPPEEEKDDASGGSTPRQDNRKDLLENATDQGDNSTSDALLDLNQGGDEPQSRREENNKDQDREFQALLSKVQTLEDKVASIEEGEMRRAARKKTLIDLSERGTNEERFDDDGIFGLSAHSYGDQDDDSSSVSIPQLSYFWKAEEDTYTAMMFSPGCFSLLWFLGAFVFAVQIVLAHAILFDQLDETRSINSAIFDAPDNVSDLVYVGQFFGLFVAMLFSRDIFTAIAIMDRFWYYKLDEKNPPRPFWSHVFYPNIFRFAQGALVLFVSFVAVVQSDNILDLFKAFTALALVTELDSFAFKIAKQGFFGGTIESQIMSAMYDKLVGAEATFRKIEFARRTSNERMICCGGSSRKTFFLLVFLGLAGGWGYFVNGQRSGKFFEQKHPFCNVSKEQREQFGNGVCDGSTLNTYECHFDGGDCLEFNVAYPSCNVEKPSLVGNGVCDGGDYNTEACGYDGGDCQETDPPVPTPSPIPSPITSPIPSPISNPNKEPATVPTNEPSRSPSNEPSRYPSNEPSRSPSNEPGRYPSNEPSYFPSICVDEPGWQSGGKGFMPLGGTTCAQMGNKTSYCDIFGTDSRYFFEGKSVQEACCLCGGSDFQTIAPSESPSFKPSVSTSPSMVPSQQPTLSFHPTVNSNVPSASPTFITAPPSECIDEAEWRVVLNGVVYDELGCDSIAGVDAQGNDFNNCDDAFTENFPPNSELGKVAETACCACGGGTHVDPVEFRAVRK